jgi:hypothetical protein
MHRSNKVDPNCTGMVGTKMQPAQARHAMVPKKPRLRNRLQYDTVSIGKMTSSSFYFHRQSARKCSVLSEAIHVYAGTSTVHGTGMM